MIIEFQIKEIRKEKNISLRALAKRSNVSRAEINDIERNFKMPKLITLQSLADALGVKITELYKKKY